MNDPGLDKPISNNAKKIERGEEEGGNDDYDQSFLDPRYVKFGLSSLTKQADRSRSRWWFASTAFPLLAVCSSKESVLSLEMALIRLPGHIRSNG